VTHNQPPSAVDTQNLSVSAQILFPQVYEELRRLAAHRMAGESQPQTLQPTALVHEAWMRLSASETTAQWRDKQHFFATAARVMRNILVDRARRKRAVKRGGDQARPEMREQAFETVVAPDEDERLLAIDEALEKFTALHPEKAQLVQLRYFVGLNQDEAAELMGLSRATAGRWWTYARAWLQDEITRHRE
jgi:RNA polymerase sigma factor (TIGR02999 family)